MSALKYICFVARKVGPGRLVLKGRIIGAANEEEAAYRLVSRWPMLRKREAVTVDVMPLFGDSMTGTRLMKIRVVRDATRCTRGEKHDWRPRKEGGKECACGAATWQAPSGHTLWLPPLSPYD